MQLFTEDQPQETSDFEPSDEREDWEDISDAEEASRREVPTFATSGAQMAHSVRLRKKRRGRKKTSIVKNEVLQEALADSVRFTTLYAFDVFKGSIEKMRKPLSWFLFLYMLVWSVSRMTATFRMAFSPLCILPGISRSILCAPLKPAFPVDFQKLVDIQGSTFDQLIVESAGGSQLSIDVLRAEMATQDLSLLVHYSDLKSKNNIVDVLHTIGRDAKKTGRGLGKLNAKVVGSIDEIMAVNNYAMATIEGAHKKAPSRLLQAISPVKLGPSAEEIIAEAFTLAMEESEQAIERLILEAELSWQDLEQLDADIGALHEMITREDKHTTVERDKLLGELWTKLGGNKKAVRGYGDRLTLLNDIGEYRKQAVAYVKAALRALHTMSDDLEVLRERVAAPGLLGGRLPLHVHMASIQNGLERLQEGRAVSRHHGGIDDKMARMTVQTADSI